MARSLNQVQLIGNLGNDPEVRSTTGGSRVATFSLATSYEWKNQSGDKQEKTQWHRVVVWGKLADIVEEYVHKGDKLYVSGRIEYRQWEDKDGQTRYSTEIIAESMIMLGSPGGSNGGQRQHGGTSTARTVRDAQRQEAKGEAFEDFPNALNDGPDDLPF